MSVPFSSSLSLSLSPCPSDLFFALTTTTKKKAGFSLAAISHYHTYNKLPPGAQYSHGFLTCVLTIILSILVTILLTIDWVRGFPSPGLSIVLKELIISSFVMTTVIIIGAATYTWLEGWSFDNAVNFCIVSFSTIGMSLILFLINVADH